MRVDYDSLLGTEENKGSSGKLGEIKELELDIENNMKDGKHLSAVSFPSEYML